METQASLAWREKLHPASFRGVPFLVDSDDIQVGRRVQLHEYPKRDQAFAEDMGRSTREINLTAWLAGADFMAARDRLLTALEQLGSGTLVHPWYGQLQVMVGACRVAHQWDEGRLVRLQCQFYEAQELALPTATVQAAQQLEQKSQLWAEHSVASFAQGFSVQDWPDFVRASALAELNHGIKQLEHGLGQYDSSIASALSQIRHSLSSLLTTPATLGQRLAQAIQGRGQQPIPTPTRAPVTLRLAEQMLQLAQDKFAFPAPPEHAWQQTPARLQQQRNTQASTTLLRRLLLAQAVSTASELVTHDAQAPLRQALPSAIAEEIRATTDDRFESLPAVHSLIRRHLTVRPAGQTIVPREILPAVVLAYDYQGNARLADEIVQRNQLRHPGFVPVVPLDLTHAEPRSPSTLKHQRH